LLSVRLVPGGPDDVVQDEPAFFEFGQEVGLEAVVEVQAGQGQQAAEADGEEAVPDGGANRKFVDVGHEAEDEAAVVRLPARARWV